MRRKYFIQAGDRFYRWLVIGIAKKKHYWLCKCDCGTEREVYVGSLGLGKTHSCGCFNSESASVRSASHRLTGTRTYRIWSAMKGRCQRKTSPDYPQWGGRGIKVCHRWQKFENFLADMGNAPDDMWIDRINNNGNYEPSNCRWASRQMQARNKTTNVILTHEGVSACVAEWAEITGINAPTISRRLYNGWSVRDALTLPPSGFHVEKLIEFEGCRLGVSGWAKKLGMNKGTLHTRLKRGWSIERALTT